MKYLPLIWRNLLRRKVRTIFTLASVFIAFVLYSFLMVQIYQLEKMQTLASRLRASLE